MHGNITYARLPVVSPGGIPVRATFTTLSEVVCVARKSILASLARANIRYSHSEGELKDDATYGVLLGAMDGGQSLLVFLF